MVTQSTFADSKSTLNEALTSGFVSGALLAQGQEILARMQQPLRLSVLGLPGSGKSTLLNLLLGARVVPDDVRLPTLGLCFGEDAAARCTLASGEVVSHRDADLRAIAAHNPAMVEIELPLPALRRLSMMEIVAGAHPVEQQRAIQWATRRTDIALWCTQDASAEEGDLWSLLPDRLLDHAFLMITKSATLQANGTLSGCLARAKEMGGDTFFKVMPIDAMAAINARRADGQVDKEALRAAGGIALISAILHKVETGQQAAADAADVFLRQIDFDPTVGAAPVAKIAKDSPSSEDVIVASVAGDDAQSVAVKAAPAVPTPDAAVPLQAQARAACATAVEQLTAEGQALADGFEAGQISQDQVLEVAVDTVTWLADYLGDPAFAKDHAMRRPCETVNDAADLVQLIQLEKSANVGLDALSLMIQLKQEIQAEMAA